MFNFNFTAASPANDMVMVISRYLVRQTAITSLSGVRQAVSRQEFQRTIDSWFRQPRKIPLGLFIDLGRRKMRPGVMEHMQDRHALRRHSESARAELRGIL